MCLPSPPPSHPASKPPPLGPALPPAAGQVPQGPTYSQAVTSASPDSWQGPSPHAHVNTRTHMHTHACTHAHMRRHTCTCSNQFYLVSSWPV